MITPKLPPLIVKKTPSGFYLYTYTNKWDPEKKRSYRAGSKKVGSLISGKKEGCIRWDDHFLVKHPELKAFVCERKGKRYVFTPLRKNSRRKTGACESQLENAATP